MAESSRPARQWRMMSETDNFNMGVKLSWSGLALMLVAPVFGLVQGFVVAGAIILAIGVVLQWLDK